MFLVVLFATWCVVFAFWTWIKPRRASPPMYPGALPLIGDAYQLAGDPEYFWEFEKKLFNFCLNNGDIIELRFGLHPVYVITDPDDSLIVPTQHMSRETIHLQFCKGNVQHWTGYSEFIQSNRNREFVSFKINLLSNLLPVSTWKPHRRLLNPAFNLQVLNTFLTEFNTQARNLVSLLATEVGKEPFNVQRYLINHLLKTVCQTSLGLKNQDQGMLDKDYTLATEDLFALFVERLKKVWLHLPYMFNWSSLKSKQDKLMKTMKNIMNKVIIKRKMELDANFGMEENKEPAQDKFKPLLDQLLVLANKQVAFTDDVIREHLDTIVAAAYDTTATAMTYTLILVGSNPDVQERIYKEIQTILENQDRDITKEDLPKLLYLEAVLKESLRLYPPVPAVARSVQCNVQLKAYILPAGSICMIGVYGINHHPMWGTDVEYFRPDRWLDSSSLPENLNAFASFSFGRRNCLGRLYGMMVMKTMLAHIFRRYRVTGDVENIQTQCDILIKPASSQQICLELRL